MSDSIGMDIKLVKKLIKKIMDIDLKKLVQAKNYQHDQGQRIAQAVFSAELKKDFDRCESLLDMLILESKIETLRRP